MPLNASFLFDEHVLRPIDHDVGDAGFLQQNLQRAEAERLVQHFFDQPLSLGAVQQRVFGVAEVLDDQANLAAQRVPLQIPEPCEIELLHELAVDTAFQFFKILGRRFHSAT